MQRMDPIQAGTAHHRGAGQLIPPRPAIPNSCARPANPPIPGSGSATSLASRSSAFSASSCSSICLLIASSSSELTDSSSSAYLDLADSQDKDAGLTCLPAHCGGTVQMDCFGQLQKHSYPSLLSLDLTFCPPRLFLLSLSPICQVRVYSHYHQSRPHRVKVYLPFILFSRLLNSVKELLHALSSHRTDSDSLL